MNVKRLFVLLITVDHFTVREIREMDLHHLPLKCSQPSADECTLDGLKIGLITFGQVYFAEGMSIFS